MFNNTMIIILDKLERFYIHISVLLKNHKSQTSCNEQIVSINSSIRTFTICYDPKDHVVKWIVEILEEYLDYASNVINSKVI
ncbi:10868_t:CDS:2 [Gigaspora margarita]|uniref:10868_t:CDS:1 n=1 Tax=Gigaspora margarita TaxID=4874 RepID=A0ABN7URZ4_GIGMA|nr:10868_t:CDS:2 [Gigaspora margarita]